jgi:hypothetical protein
MNTLRKTAPAKRCVHTPAATVPPATRHGPEPVESEVRSMNDHCVPASLRSPNANPDTFAPSCDTAVRDPDVEVGRTQAETVNDWLVRAAGPAVTRWPLVPSTVAASLSLPAP